MIIMTYNPTSPLNISTTIFFLKYCQWLLSKPNMSPNIKYLININIKTPQSSFLWYILNYSDFPRVGTLQLMLDVAESNILKTSKESNILKSSKEDDFKWLELT